MQCCWTALHTHSLASQHCYITQRGCDLLFTRGDVVSSSLRNGSDGFLRDLASFRDSDCAPIRVSEQPKHLVICARPSAQEGFACVSAGSFGAGAREEFAGVASLRVFWSEEPGVLS